MPHDISPQTIGRMASEIVGTPIPEAERLLVANLLQALAADMTAFRAMNVGDIEPALIYDAGATES
jgi:hypothetical protein